ncbi:hypothetical protein ACFLY6_02295 [Candidatus Dependentiae bacterium]
MPVVAGYVDEKKTPLNIFFVVGFCRVSRNLAPFVFVVDFVDALQKIAAANVGQKLQRLKIKQKWGIGKWKKMSPRVLFWLLLIEIM